MLLPPVHVLGKQKGAAFAAATRPSSTFLIAARILPVSPAFVKQQPGVTSTERKRISVSPFIRFIPV
jgi:hypothetical protein